MQVIHETNELGISPISIKNVFEANTIMDEILDKSDNITTYYSKILLDGFGLWAESVYGESYLIQYYVPEKATKDKRDALIRIYHNSKVNPHEKIEFVIDLKNHTPKMPFHLNLTALSEQTCRGCPTCKKYFLPLNHAPILANAGVGTGKPYKIIDWNKTMEQIRKSIEEKGFFVTFSKTFKHSIG